MQGSDGGVPEGEGKFSFHRALSKSCFCTLNHQGSSF